MNIIINNLEKMKENENDTRELKSGTETFKLSLRKQKIGEYMLKRRLGSNDQNYSVQIANIIVKPEYNSKKFDTLLELLLFVSSIFQNQNSDINDVKFAIHLFKQAKIKNEIKDEVNESNILKYIANIILKFINDKIVVDELLGLLINFSFFLKPETNMNLLTNEYMEVYSKLSSQYFNDNIIFTDLITLLGNLANDNSSAQKIFYNTKLFDEIYTLSKNEKAPKIKRDISIFFLANFSKGISKNNYLVKNLTILQNLVDIMDENIRKKENNKNCLVSLGELSEIKELVEYIVTKKEFFYFLYENTNPEFYWAINKILVNLTFISENINLYMIESYKNQIFPYIFRLLDSSSNIMKGQGLFLLGNLIENEKSKINGILNAAGFYDKIFDNLGSISIDIIDKVTFIMNVISNSSDKEDIFKLYQKNIHLKLMNILKNNYNREIISRTIDAIIDFLQKDTQDGIIRQSLLDNGIKDIFENLEVDRNDAELFLKVEEIIKNYF